MFSKVRSRIFSLGTKLPTAVSLPKTGTSFVLENTKNARTFKTTTASCDLTEFFDDKKYWGEKKVQVGRSWHIDELRLKSNVDLHKLWYVLLKERNMLLTMEHDAKEECEYFPNPERRDKVEESMENLETVVRERNKAYFELETGTSGERSGEEFENIWGFQEYRQYEEFPVPKLENQEYIKKKEAEPKSSDKEKSTFYFLLRERQIQDKRRQIKAQEAAVVEILKRFPNCDHEALKEKYHLLTPKQFDRIVRKVNARVHENNDVPWLTQKWNGATFIRSKMTWKQKVGG